MTGFEDKMSDEYHNLLGLIAGGFVQEGSQCVVIVESNDNSEHLCMSSVKSATPRENPDELMKKLSSEMCKEVSKISVSVYAICGGIHGTSL